MGSPGILAGRRGRVAARRAHGAGLLATLVLGGCAGGGWVRDQPQLAERARRDPQGFVEAAYAQEATLSTLAGSYTIRVSKGLGRRTFDTALAARAPEALDLTFFSPVGAIEAFVRAGSAETGLFFKQDGVLYRGPSGPESFGRALGFELSAADAVAVFLGYGMDRRSLPTGVASWDAEAQRVRVDYGGTARGWIDPRSGRFERIVRTSGADTIEVRFADWRQLADGSSIPAAIEVQVSPDGFTLEIALRGAPHPGIELPDAIFELLVPADTLQLPLTELARQGGLFRRALAETESGP